MKLKKSLLATAVAAALGGGASAATAGVMGTFGTAGEAGCVSDTGVCVPIEFGADPIGVNVFTSGFPVDPDNPDGPRFLPNTTGPMEANISGGDMNWEELSFGIVVDDQQLFPPDVTSWTVTSNLALTVTGDPGFCDVTQYDCFGIVSTWTGTNADTGLSAEWRLEGVASAEKVGGEVSRLELFDVNGDGLVSSFSIPEPGPAWLVGTGLVGLASLARRRKAKKS